MAQGPESRPQQAFLFAQVPAEGSEGPDRLLSVISLKKCPFYEGFFGGLANGGSDSSPGANALTGNAVSRSLVESKAGMAREAGDVAE
jgi:hypothetical protein